MFPSPDTLTHTGAIPPIAGTICILLAVAAYRRFRLREGWADIATESVVLLSVLGILAVTLFRGVGDLSFSPRGMFQWAHGGVERFVSQFGNDSEITLNILLFAPAGAILTIKHRKPLIVILILSTLSLCIEFTQGLLGLGNPDASDLLANSIGATLGVALAATAICFTKYRTKRLLWAAIGTSMVALLVSAAAFPVARLRQESMQREVQDRFKGTTLDDYQTWEANGTLPQRAFTVSGTFSDGARISSAEVEVRFPINTLGIHECVIAVWRRGGFDARRASGNECTVFMG